jgi:transglutaminase-like putative cysteine protease
LTRDRGRPEWGAVAAWRRAGFLMALLIGGLAAPVFGHAAEYTVGPVPAWVVPVAAGVSDAIQISKSSEGVAYLLTDTQVLAGEHERVRYRRLASTALNASGVDSVANIEIPFDPSYQALVLHSIDIVRNGHVIPKLATAKIRVIQRETELETRIYDGTKTANVFLDDVRVGDTIDYAYSVSGRNPVFKDADFGTLPLQFGTPVARIHVRLLLPLGKPVTVTAHHTELKAAVTEHDGLRDYVWDVVDPPTLTVESGAPDWYSPYAEIAWSEYPDWASVAQWALPLYQPPTKLSPELQAEGDRIAKAQSGQTGRMLAALRLVQGEVRYLGVEIGQNSHAPNSPALVFARRFGDCKDKTLLTLTLLDRLGVEAHAALVNTGVQRGIADVLPNPAAFDHVIVQARIDGKTWWIDPTRSIQQADPAQVFQPDFGLALIVDSHTRDLTSMRRADAASASRTVNAVFDASAGFDKPVRYTVTTTTEGEAAEGLRTSLSSTNLGDVQKNYLNFYASSYPHITVAAPLQVSDDKASNRITTTESYVISDISSPSADGKHRFADIYKPDIAQLLRDPAVTIRKAPLRLTYPSNVSQHTEVLLPDAWPIQPESTTVVDPAFRFEQVIRIEGLKLIINDHYQALTDEVAARDMSRYLGNLARARGNVGYELSWVDPLATPSAPAMVRASGFDRMNWPVALLGLAMLGLWSWLAVAIHRYDPPPSSERDDRWVGIAGWLIVLAIALVWRPVAFGSELLLVAKTISIDKWSLLTTYGSSSYNALWAPLLLFELAVASMELVLSLLLLRLFFQRRSSFPRVAILLLVVGVVLQMVDHMLAGLLPIKYDPAKVVRIVQTTVGVLAWSTYLLRSRRVKATFVKRYRMSVPPAFPQAVAGVDARGPVMAAATDPD